MLLYVMQYIRHIYCENSIFMICSCYSLPFLHKISHQALQSVENFVMFHPISMASVEARKLFCFRHSFTVVAGPTLQKLSF